MRKRNLAALFLAILMAILTGCAALEQLSHRFEGVFGESPENQFVKTCLLRAMEDERGGDHAAALKNYKMALTVHPSNPEAVMGRNRVEAFLRNSAEEHYRKGLELQKQDKVDLARQQFLIALRLWPDHSDALDMLTVGKALQVKGPIVHKIQPGDSLSRLAMKYYGDPRKYLMIAKYNNLGDSEIIHVGREIIIPEMESMELPPSREILKPEGSEGGFQAAPKRSHEAEANQEVMDPVGIYRELGIELFKEKRYEEALAEFNKVLSARPKDHVAMEYSYESCFELAVALFEKQEYLAARDQFRASLRYKNDCQKCQAYIRKSEELYKEMHYKQGIQYYGREQLTEAIREWEMVRNLDPNYKRVGDHIHKAKELLKRLQDLKNELEEGSTSKIEIYRLLNNT